MVGHGAFLRTHSPVAVPIKYDVGPCPLRNTNPDTSALLWGLGQAAMVKDRPPVVLVDLPAFGRPTRLCWRKCRWRCPDPVGSGRVGSWPEHAPSIGWPRLAMTDRAGRWVTAQVSCSGRTINEVAVELGTDWHTMNDAHTTNGPTENQNNLIKRIKRVAFGFTNFANDRIRPLLYTGRPNWDLLTTITPTLR